MRRSLTENTAYTYKKKTTKNNQHCIHITTYYKLYIYSIAKSIINKHIIKSMDFKLNIGQTQF